MIQAEAEREECAQEEDGAARYVSDGLRYWGSLLTLS